MYVVNLKFSIAETPIVAHWWFQPYSLGPHWESRRLPTYDGAHRGARRQGTVHGGLAYGT